MIKLNYHKPQVLTFSIQTKSVLKKVFVIVLRLLAVVASLAYVKIYTGSLSLGEVGYFFYLTTLSYAINALVFVPVDFYMQAKLSKSDLVPFLAVRQLIISSLLIGLLTVFIFSLPLIYFHQLVFSDFFLLYGTSGLLYLCSSVRNFLNIRGRLIFVSSLILWENFSKAIIFIIFTIFFKATAQLLMLATMLALSVELFLIAGGSRGVFKFTKTPLFFDSSLRIIREVLPLSGAAASNTIQLQTYRIAYPLLLNSSSISGAYGVVSNIGSSAMSVFSSIYSQIYLPKIYNSSGDGIKTYVIRAVIFSLIILVFMSLVAPFLVISIANEQYLPYSGLIGFGVVIEAANLIMGAYTVVATLTHRCSLLLTVNMVASVFSVIGTMLVLYLYPKSPFLIGYPILFSQILIVFMAITLIPPPK